MAGSTRSRRPRRGRTRASAPIRGGIELIFPPCARLVTFPELGIPQLAGYLRSRGVQVRLRDLNLVFLRDVLLGPAQLASMRRALKETGGGAVGAILSPEMVGADAARGLLSASRVRHVAHGILGVPGGPVEAIAALALAAEAHFGLSSKGDDCCLEGICRRAAQPNPLLSRFYEESVFSRWRREGPPLVLGLSIGMISQVLPSLYLARETKRRFPDCRVIIGGPWVSQAWDVLPGLITAIDCVDYCCRYEGERPLEELYARLAEGREPGEVPGLMVRERTGVRCHAPAAPIPLDDLPPPDFKGFRLRDYQDHALPLQTSRNCLWGRCVFCYHRQHSAASGVEERSPEVIVRQIRRLQARTGFDRFFLADSCTSQALIGALAERLRMDGPRVRLAAMSRSTGAWTRSFSTRAAAAGLEDLFIGLEVADEAELTRLDKGITLAGLAHDLRHMHGAGIRTHLFVLDYPSIPMDALESTFRWLLARRAHITSFIFQRFELGRGTEVFRRPGMFGITPTVDVDRWLDVFSVPHRAARRRDDAAFERIVSDYTRRFQAARAGSAARLTSP